MTLTASDLRPGTTTLVEGLAEPAVAYYLARYLAGRRLLVVTSDLDRAEKLADELGAYGLEDVTLFPAEEHDPFEEVSPDPRLVAQRLHLRHRALAA